MSATAATVRRIRRCLSVAAPAAAALALVVPTTADASGCANTNVNPNDVPLSVASRATLCLLNRERRAHHLRALRENSKLDLASVRHAKDMARNDYFAHGNVVGRIRATHYLDGARSWYVGENIAWGSFDFATPRSIVRMWMNSPPHRANILNRRFRDIGIGIARGAPRAGVSNAATYVTDFGRRG